jgi:hypothetical protein
MGVSGHSVPQVGSGTYFFARAEAAGAQVNVFNRLAETTPQSD